MRQRQTVHSAHSIHRERVLQDHLIDRLVTGEGYQRRDPATDYDRAFALDKALVLRFVRDTQPEEWENSPRTIPRQPKRRSSPSLPRR